MNHKQNKFDIFLYFCSFSASLISSWSVKHAANREEVMNTEMEARVRMKERGVTHQSLCFSFAPTFEQQKRLASEKKKKEKCEGTWKTKAGSFSWHAYIYIKRALAFSVFQLTCGSGTGKSSRRLMIRLIPQLAKTQKQEHEQELQFALSHLLVSAPVQTGFTHLSGTHVFDK